MLPGEIVLQGIRLPGAEFITDRGISKPRAKTVRSTGGKLVGIVEEPSVTVNGSKIGNKRRVRPAKTVGQGNVVTVVELPETCTERPFPRSRGIPCDAQPGSESGFEIVADRPVRATQTTRSGRARIRPQAGGVVQTVAGGIAKGRI